MRSLRRHVTRIRQSPNAASGLLNWWEAAVSLKRVLSSGYDMTKKLKNESGLLKEALRLIMKDAVRRGVAEFEPTDSQNLKIEYAYRLLVHDKEIIPLPANQVTLPNMKHRLAMWVSHKLPPEHALLS